MEIEKIKRTVYYYEFKIVFDDEFTAPDGDLFREFFRIIKSLAQSKSPIRYQMVGEKEIFIQDVNIDVANKYISGKLRSIRRDLFPEIMNTKTDVAQGIEAKDEEGLVETTHFVLDYSKKAKKFALEHNQFGAKIIEFAYYLQVVGVNKSAVKQVGYLPIVNDDLASLKDRINRCSEFFVKVHKDNIHKIQTLDKDLFEALNSSIDHFKSEYGTLSLKFDYRKRADTKEVNNSIFKLIDRIRKDSSVVELFNVLSVKAEDNDKGNLLQTFDLLVNKIKSELYVEKQKKHRTVVSADILEQMKSEMVKNKI